MRQSLAIELPGVPPSLPALLTEAACGDRLALVGGGVRDLLLHRVHNDPWRGLPDLDLVVQPLGTGGEGEPAAAHRLARRLRRILPPEAVPFCQEHGAYGTVELELRLPEGSLLLDVASARREQYPEPGENPLVQFGSLEEDLARRDFTINAMALLLAAGEDGRHALLDPHSGQADLERRLLRFLHGASVADDPTRVVRGARYVARLGFSLAPESLEQLRRTLELWPWPWRPGDPPGQAPPGLGTRLRMELELLLEREPWRLALAALQQWGALELLDSRLQADGGWRLRVHRAARLGLPPLPALLMGASDPLALAERLQLPHRQHRLLLQTLHLRQRLEAAGALGQEARGGLPSRWCALLEAPGGSPAAVALALAADLGPRRPLLRWWHRWRHLGAPVAAAELIAAGERPGPALGERLRRLRAERLDREPL